MFALSFFTEAGGAARRAAAVVPPTPTPKPSSGGSLSGVYDALVSPYDATRSEDGAGANTCGDLLDNGGDTQADVADPDCRDKSEGRFHCIVRLDHDGADNRVKAATVCYVDTPGLSPGSALPDRADLIPGPPPPPPYTTAAPTKLAGSYNPGTDILMLTGCFANVGGSQGPNVIWQVTVPMAKPSLPNLHGTVLIYPNQSINQCNAKLPGGPAPER